MESCAVNVWAIGLRIEKSICQDLHNCMKQNYQTNHPCCITAIGLIHQFFLRNQVQFSLNLVLLTSYRKMYIYLLFTFSQWNASKVKVSEKGSFVVIVLGGNAVKFNRTGILCLACSAVVDTTSLAYPLDQFACDLH